MLSILAQLAARKRADSRRSRRRACPQIERMEQRALLAVDAYLVLAALNNVKLDTEPTTGQTDAIKLRGFEYGASRTITNPTSAGGKRTAGIPVSSELSFQTHVGAQTPLLFQESVIGRAGTATLYVDERGPSGKPRVFEELVMTNALVASDHVSFNPTNDRPIEDGTLNFTKIQVTVFTYNAEGVASKHTVTYDFVAGLNR